MAVGLAPGTGPQLVDGLWLQGLAGGTNQTFNSSITANNAASQATGTSIPAQTYMVEIDTSVNTGSVVLPAAVAGTELAIVNNTANTINVYANPNTNQLTAALDTINALTNATAFQPTANTVTWFMCVKNGKWFSK